MLSVLRGAYNAGCNAIGWAAAVGSYVALIAAAPVYVPVCISMWVGFVLTDMQGNTSLMLEKGLDSATAIMEQMSNADAA